MDRQHTFDSVINGLHQKIRLIFVEAFDLAPADLLPNGAVGNTFGLAQRIRLLLRQLGVKDQPAPVFFLHTSDQKLLSAVSALNDGGEQRHGENDAYDGDQCAAAVCQERFARKAVQNVHFAPPRMRSSRTMRPSSMAMIRSACSAIDSSWVITIRVCLYFTFDWRRSSTIS